MCFTNNYEWYAVLHNDVEHVSDEASQCYECGDAIPAGAMRRSTWQQEHEGCQWCEYEELEPDEEPCEHHDYGETFECDICMNCSKLLKAIEAVEADEGCPKETRQPAYGELWEEMTQGNCVEYLNRAWEMFPELTGTDWSNRLLGRMR